MLETFFFSLVQVKHEITPLKQKAEIPHIRLTHPSVTELLTHSPVRLWSYFLPTVSIFQAILFVCLSSSSSVIVKFFAA